MDGTDNARADSEGMQPGGFQQDGPGLFDDGPALFDAPEPAPAAKAPAKPRTRSRSKKKDADAAPEAKASVLDESFVQDGEPLIPLDEDAVPAAEAQPTPAEPVGEQATEGQPTEDEKLVPDEAELADPEVSSTPTLSAVEEDERSAEHTDEPAAEPQAPEEEPSEAPAATGAAQAGEPEDAVMTDAGPTEAVNHTDSPNTDSPNTASQDVKDDESQDTADELRAELGFQPAPGVHVSAPHSPVLDPEELAELDADDEGDEDADADLPAPGVNAGALEVETSDAGDPDSDLPLGGEPIEDADDPEGEAAEDFEVVVPEAFTTPITEIAPPSVDLPEDAYGDQSGTEQSHDEGEDGDDEAEGDSPDAGLPDEVDDATGEDDDATQDDILQDDTTQDDGGDDADEDSEGFAADPASLAVEEPDEDDFEPEPEDDDIVVPASDPMAVSSDPAVGDDATALEGELVTGDTVADNTGADDVLADDVERAPRPPMAEAPLALYRRYRPETFAEVIGQEHVTEPLMRALENNRVNHAYLFSGPRGCGKTTSARILARALNCEQGPTPTPCGVCQSCRDLARGGGGSIDVIEIDAASHGGVDDARDLRERAFFAPVNSRYKIYIVDEAHMVTTAGFNAMLKLVEEPPPHVKFVFATTEPEKVIGTIRSRTHHYPFRLVPPKVLTGYLAELCEREGVAVEPSVLPLVVRAGAGSVRDSLSVLDQLLGGAGRGGVTYDQASALLGYTPESLLDDIMDAFAAGDAAGVFATIDRVVEVGQDPRRFAEDLLRRLRDLVIVAAVPDALSSGLVDVAPDQAERLQVQAAGMGRGELTRAAEVIATGLTEMRGTTAPRLHLELMCSRVLLPGADVDERGIHARLERLERRISAAGGALPAAASEAPAPARWDDVEAARPATPAAQQAPAQRPASAPAGQPDASAGGRDSNASVFPQGGNAPQSQGESGGQPNNQQPSNQGPNIQPGGQRPAEASGGQPRGQRPAPQNGQLGAAQNGQRPAGVPSGQRPAQGIPGGQRPAGGMPGQRPAQQAPQNAPQDAPQQGAPQSAPQRGGVDLSATDLRREWPRVLDAVKSRRRFAWILLNQNAQVIDLADGVLTLGFVNQGARDNFVSGGSSDVLRDCLVQTLMLDVRIDPIINAGGPGDQPSQPAQQPRREPEPQQQPPQRNEWSQQARENIRPTSSRVEQGDDEPPPDDEADGDFAVSHDDIALDEGGESAAELITRQLGAQPIADEQL